jgi:serine/threonine-protein kinase
VDLAQRQPATWTIGTVVGGKYRLEALLGAGGFGAVFRAFDQSGGRVALKILSRSAMLQADAMARFQREARLAMLLKHPNTVRLLDFGDAGSGTPFIAFELLDGVSLERRIAAGPLPVAEAVSIAIEILGSLEEAHASHVIHRDVKPANVFVCKQPPGAIKLLDFGVAQETPPGSAMEKLTREGTMIGTPAYMAPEQLAGTAAGPGTDFFALALVLAEMVSGVPVYQGDALAICLAKLNGHPTPFSIALPPALLAVLQCAAAPDPANRYRTAAQMRSALLSTGLASGRASLAPQPLSGKFGTHVIERPSHAPVSLNRALAATAPPSMNTPLAVHPTPSRGMSGTTPLITDALSHPTPRSLASPLAATNLDPTRPPSRPLLAATVNDPNAAKPLAGTVSMDDAPRAFGVAERKPRRITRWIVALVLVALVAGGALAAYRYLVHP